MTRISLIGVRLGATLAARAAARLGGVDALVLWAPCTGRGFVRELRAASATRGLPDSGAGDVEALGYVYTAETLQELAVLDREPDVAAPARCALIIRRDDMPGSEPLTAKYRAMGVDATDVTWPGYAGMMVEPHDAVLTTGTLTLIAQWLGATIGFAADRATPRAAVPPPTPAVVDGVREVPLSVRAALAHCSACSPSRWPGKRPMLIPRRRCCC